MFLSAVAKATFLLNLKKTLPDKKRQKEFFYNIPAILRAIFVFIGSERLVLLLLLSSKIQTTPAKFHNATKKSTTRPEIQIRNRHGSVYND